jgi:hypothetical protein
LSELPRDPTAQSLSRRLIKASTAVDTGYRDVSSRIDDQFIKGMAAVARHAKKTRTLLQDLFDLRLIGFEVAKDLILEARSLEGIFMASLRSAKRRMRARGRRQDVGSHVADGAPSADAARS